MRGRKKSLLQSVAFSSAKPIFLGASPDGIITDGEESTPWVVEFTGADLEGGCRRCAPFPEIKLSSSYSLKICLPQRSVTSFPRGAPLPKKNPGSAPGLRTFKLNLVRL